MPESAWFIPDDWLLSDGEWTAYCLQWPDSWLWRLHLRSLLFTLTRGRDWDRDSGSIKDAQAIGWEIFDRNSPFADCSGGAECPDFNPVERIVYIGCGTGLSDDESEDVDMGCNSPIPFETREDGLYYYHCCQWVKIWPGAGADGTVPPDYGDDPLEPPGADPATYNACGKANAAAEIIFKVAHAAWYVGNNENFWEWPGEYGSRFPELHGGETFWADACFWAFSSDTGSEESTVIPEGLKQTIECKLAERLEDDDQGTTDDDYKYIFGIIQDWFPVSEDPFNAAILRFWVAAYATIGKGDLRNISRLGATTTANCDCPEAWENQLFSGYAVYADWRYVFDFRKALGSYIELDASTFHQLNEGLWSNCGPTQNNNGVGLKVRLDQLNNGSVVTNIGILYRTRGNEDYNNSSGCSVKVEDTEHIGVTDMEAASGTTPAQAGVWTITKTVNDPLGASEDVFDASVNVYHAGAQLDDLIENSIVIIALIVAGTGPGPLSTPPA